MSITVRKMRLTDREQVLDLLARWNIAPIAPSLIIPMPERAELIVENTHVALDDDVVVGVISFVEISGELGEGASFALAPGYQKQGIGEQLGDANLGEMYARGLRRMRVETDRPEAIRWLLRRGHRIVGTAPKRHAFGSPDADHWTVLEVDLKEPSGRGRSSG